MLRTWHRWTETAPEEITTSMRLMHIPPLPELPDFLRGRSVAVIDGAFAGDAEQGAGAVAAGRSTATTSTSRPASWPTRRLGAAVAGAGERALAALSAWKTGSAYLNFVERPTDTSAFYSAAAHERLGAVRAAVDPDGLIVSNHPVPAAV